MEEKYVPLVDTRAEEVFDALSSRFDEAEMRRVRSAYEFARMAHSKQRRKTGEPYIVHPIAVARIAGVELGLDANVVIAAFLHDVVEDTPYTLEDIRERFGDDVASLVRVVTKPNKDKYEMSKQLDNFKQMLNAMQGDIRGILIKLADRLHNMRTLQSMRTDKQMKIAGETDYFYAPLANRLGYYEVKTELENLSFRYRCPHEYEAFMRLLKNDARIMKRRMDEFVAKVEEVLRNGGVKARVLVVQREPYSLWRKMKKHGVDFHHLKNKHFTEIIFEDTEVDKEKAEVLRIYSLLTDVFREKPGGISNYIDSPKENGYRSFHVKLLSDAGVWEEVHISSERMARASQYGFLGAGEESYGVHKWLEKFRSNLNDISHSNPGADFIENVVTSFYNDDIMVFTPNGKPVILPQRAKALDFAFEIHSKIGQFAKYARVNGQLVSLMTELKRGDVVEIFTDEQALPKAEWAEKVVTYKAKRWLRNYVARLPKVRYDRCPQCNPIPGEEVIGFMGPYNQISIHKRDCPVAIRTASKMGDSIVPVQFSENPDILYPVKVRIRGVDRYHMLSDLIQTITERMRLSIASITTSTVDYIFDITISFSVHSYDELHEVINEIYSIKGVDEVHQVQQ